MLATPIFASELLESRRLMAATLIDGVLTVEGTEAGDVISILQRSSTLTVRVGSERTIFVAEAVDELVVNALGGNDRVTLGKLGVPAGIDGGAGDDRLSGGSADDVILGGDGNDRISGAAGNDQLFGAAGNDKILGDAGNDELDGGDGRDLINGGADFDSTAASDDIVTGVEDNGGNTPGDDDNENIDGYPNFSTIDVAGLGAGFAPLIPLDTTGFNIRPGTNVISPRLSSAPYGNTAYSDPFTGITLQAGGAFVYLPSSGAYGRSLGQSAGVVVGLR